MKLTMWLLCIRHHFLGDDFKIKKITIYVKNRPRPKLDGLNEAQMGKVYQSEI